MLSHKPQQPLPENGPLQYMQNYRKLYYNNAVRDYSLAQGVTHPSDLTVHTLNDINLRYVTIENSGLVPIGIGITTTPEKDPVPPLKFKLQAGEIRHIGINSIGEMMQFIHIIDLESKTHVGRPYPMRTDSNQFVLRNGINMWFVQAFHRSTYNAAH